MKLLSILIVGLLLVPLAPALALAARVDGFTEPYQSVEVATTEVGIITALEVGEGDRVEAGQLLARLDDEVQVALLAIAAKNLALRGRLESTRAELSLRSQRLQKLESLQQAGHARPEEVERARADLTIAEAQVLAAEEEMAMRELEYSKTALQLQRRQILAPLSGVVATVLKQPGEFVAPTDPQLLHIVQLDRLLAVFSVPSYQAAQIEVGMQMEVSLAAQVVTATVERMAPLTDAESDTVRLKLRLDNSDGRFRSGQRCALLLPDTSSVPMSVDQATSVPSGVNGR